MKVFLLSDLVAHELASMQIDQKWLSFAHFTESARLWVLRHAPELEFSEAFLQEIEREVLQIATRLSDNQAAQEDYLQSQRLFDDLVTANYAHPLGEQALSATLAACREKGSRGALCAALNSRTLAQGAASRDHAAAQALTCHPALCRLACNAAHFAERAELRDHGDAGQSARAGGKDHSVGTA